MLKLSISDNNLLSKLKSVTGYLLPFILTFLFLYLAFKNIEFESFLKHLTNVNWIYLFIFIGLFFFSHFVGALRWKTIISSVKTDVSLLSLFGSTMIMYGVNLAVPRLGEIYRASFLGKWEDISRTQMFGTIIVERVIDLIFLLLAILLSIAIYPEDLFQEIPELKGYLYLLSVIVAGLILALILVVMLKEKFYKPILFIVGKISPKLSDKLKYVFDMLLDGFSTIRSLKVLGQTLVYSAIIMFLYGYNAYIGFHMIKMDQIQEVTLAMGWIVMTISALGIVAPTPGGTGTFHLLCSISLGIFGFGENVALAYAVLSHIISTLLFITSTIFFVNFINIRKDKSKRVNFFSVLKQSENAK